MQRRNAQGDAKDNGRAPLRGTSRALARLGTGRPDRAHGAWLWRLLLILVIPCLCAAGAWAQDAAAPQAGAPAHQRFLAQALVPDQPARYAWPRAAQALGREADGVYLRLALLDEWLLALEGQPAQAGRTIEAAIAHGRGVDPYFLERRARAVWPSILKTQLRPQWDMDGPGVPLPPELDAFGSDLAPEGPGLWVHRFKDGRPRGLYLWLGVRNGLSEPLPLPEFALRLGRAGQQPAAPLMQCALPRYSTRQLVMPQTTQHYLCRAGEGDFGVPPAGVGWLAQMGEWFSQGASLQTQLPQQDQALSRTGRILEQIDNAAVDDFVRGRPACEAQGNCAQQAARSAKAAAAEARSQARVQVSSDSAASHQGMPLWLKRLIFWGAVAGALVLYGLVAHHVSVALASFLLWMGLAVPCAMYLRSLWAANWADSWGGIVVIPLSLAAMAAPFLGTFIAYSMYQLLVSAEARRTAVMFLLAVLLAIVLNVLEHWLL